MSVWQSAFATTLTDPAGLGRGHDDVRRSQIINTEGDRGLAADGLARARRPDEAGLRLRHARRLAALGLGSIRERSARRRQRAAQGEDSRREEREQHLAAILRASTTFTRRGRNHEFLAFVEGVIDG